MQLSQSWGRFFAESQKIPQTVDEKKIPTVTISKNNAFSKSSTGHEEETFTRQMKDL